MARDRHAPADSQIPWWGYLVAAVAIAVVIVAAVIAWHVLALVVATAVHSRMR